jgi:3-phosphoshikimate 1-carboxyvinyltransferase
MIVRISPIADRTPDASPVTCSVPPDKSILHRALFIGSLTRSAIRIPIAGGHALAHDIIATILALESLGVPVEISESAIELNGVGRRGYRAPTHVINCANSGTTARLLMGLLAGQEFNAALSGDTSLSARPMKRLADLLSLMGAEIITTPEGTLPTMIAGHPLEGRDLRLPVASAQMKSALLLAGLFAEGTTNITELSPTRDHTERMLEAFGFGIERTENISIAPEVEFEVEDEIDYQVPGDFSSAAFLLTVAVLLRKRLTITNVGLNPTRTRFLEVLTLMGVDSEAVNVTEQYGEPRGDIVIYGERVSHLSPIHVSGTDIPLLIDELPILMTLAMFADGESVVRDATELRLKESDRLKLTVDQFRKFGVEVEELEDGVDIHGVPNRQLQSCDIDHGGDHRLAMCFSIAGFFCKDVIEIPEAETVSVSYPEFYRDLATLVGSGAIEIQAQ